MGELRRNHHAFWGYPDRKRTFLNDGDTPEQIRKWVRQMKESRLQAIGLFVIWEQVEPKDNQWDFTKYDAVFAEAELCGMKVIPTFMSVNPPKWMKKYGLYGI